MKSEMRRFIKNLRREMTDEKITKISDQIYKNLIDHDLYKNAKSIFVYLSMDKEINTYKIINHALEDGKKVYVPYLENKKMNLRRLRSLDDLTEGAFGIKTSKNEESITNPDLSLVSGLSFDKNKNRLGYGGGYYDKYLANSQTISIGLFADVARSFEIPTDETDISLDYILTEKWYFLKNIKIYLTLSKSLCII